MILRAQNLVKSFGSKSNETLAVRDVSLDLDFGEMLYIVGPSGSGKTTLLSMISGILRPNKGTVQIKEQNLWSLSSDKLADLRLHTIGFVFQDFHLFDQLTSKENVALPLILQKKDWEESLNEAEKQLEIVGLASRANLAPNRLSIGEQQRVAIARALITKPDLLIMDEPTASLDGETGRKILSFVRQNVLNAKRSIIVVTHDNRIYDFATRIIHMEDGKIFKEGRGTLDDA